MNKIKLIKLKTTIEVHAPYSEKFIDDLKQMRASWVKEKRAWRVREDLEDILREKLFEHFSYVEGDNMVSVRCEFLDDCDSETRENLNVFGYELATAKGRDYCTVKVPVLKGSIHSKGSVKNYYVRADEGTQFTIEVYKRALERIQETGVLKVIKVKEIIEEKKVVEEKEFDIVAEILKLKKEGKLTDEVKSQIIDIVSENTDKVKINK